MLWMYSHQYQEKLYGKKEIYDRHWEPTMWMNKGNQQCEWSWGVSKRRWKPKVYLEKSEQLESVFEKTSEYKKYREKYAEICQEEKKWPWKWQRVS